jgi:hypothetical protein
MSTRGGGDEHRPTPTCLPPRLPRPRGGLLRKVRRGAQQLAERFALPHTIESEQYSLHDAEPGSLAAHADQARHCFDAWRDGLVQPIPHLIGVVAVNEHTRQLAGDRIDV